MKVSNVNSTNLYQHLHHVSNCDIRQQFDNPSTRFSKHTHLNDNEGDVIPDGKQQIRPHCDNWIDYDIISVVTKFENEDRTAVYANKYFKYASREKYKCPLMTSCISKNLLYKCTVHRRWRLYV